MRLKLFCLFVVLMLLLVGCGVGPAIRIADDSGATAEGVASVVKANNEFALDMYSQIKEDSNMFFSPWSMSTALTMTYEGARGETAQEMKNVLRLPDDAMSRRYGFARLHNILNKKKKEYKLYTANSLWAQKDYYFLPDYKDVVMKHYAGKMSNVDFAGQTEKTRTIINNWVEMMTAKKIKELFKPGVLSGDTRLVLTNAIYFKGDWLKEFTKSKTKDQPFKVTPTKTVKVPMMQHKGDENKFSYFEDDKIQVLELPYQGEDLSMMILLPKDHDLADLEEKITAEKLKELKSGLREQNIKVYLPKFKLETQYSLKENLKEMGMPTAFSMDADFSGMDGSDWLFISAVVHKAYVDVNEKGTEAAAATGVVMTLKAVAPGKVFRADHPFMFLIQEKDTGNILFLGKVVDPSI